jgi:hypothetical protein
MRRIVRNALLLYVAFLLTTALLGFNGSVMTAAIVAIVICVNWSSKYHATVGTTAAIIFLLLFDSDAFAFTDFKIRLWYPLLVLLSLLLLARSKKRFGASLQAGTFRMLTLTLVGYFAVRSILYLFIDDAAGVLSIAKYWLFSVGLIAALVSSFRTMASDAFEDVCDLMLTLYLFVSVWGLMQFAMNLTTLGARFQLDFKSIRPSAFFSETTWYAEYLVFGVLLLARKTIRLGRPSYWLAMLPGIAGIAISVTRNAWFALAVVLIVVLFLFVGFGLKARRGFLFNRYTLSLTLVGTAAIALALQTLPGAMEFLMEKLSLRDASAVGRQFAFAQSVQDIRDSWLLGHGFTWYPYQVTTSGAYMGAKSFNLFFMIAYVFGVSGVAALGLLILGFYSRSLLRYARLQSLDSGLGLIWMTCYLAMAVFAPIHQYPFGMLVLALAIAFGSDDGLREASTFHYRRRDARNAPENSETTLV